MVYSASFLTDLGIEADGHPVARGIGFSQGARYMCQYCSGGACATVAANYKTNNVLHCSTSMTLDDKNALTKVLKAAGAKAHELEVTVTIKITAATGKLEDVATSRPKAIPGQAKTVPPLKFKLSQQTCSDGLQNPLEIGADCGLAACNKLCARGKAERKKGETCDQATDCTDAYCGKKKTCEHGLASCTEWYKVTPGMKSGIYTLALDSDPRNLDKKDFSKGITFKVYCEVDYDKAGHPAGTFMITCCTCMLRSPVPPLLGNLTLTAWHLISSNHACAWRPTGHKINLLGVDSARALCTCNATCWTPPPAGAFTLVQTMGSRDNINNARMNQDSDFHGADGLANNWKKGGASAPWHPFYSPIRYSLPPTAAPSMAVQADVGTFAL